MDAYRAQVLHDRFLDLETGIYKYPFQITEKDVLSLAGIKSRSTLSAPYHVQIKKELKSFILKLKEQAGKKTSAPETAQDYSGVSDSVVVQKATRVAKLAETIGALGYKIIALQKELDALRGSFSAVIKAVNLPSRRGRSRDGRG